MVKLNRKVAALRPSATMAAENRATELKEAGVDVISLAAGEPDFDTPERIKDAARRAMAAGQTKYTPAGGTSKLKQAISLKLRRDNGLEYEAAEVMASAGAKQSAFNVIATLFDEGDEVIIPTPAWVSFAEMVRLSGAEPRLVAAREKQGFLLSAQDLRSALTPKTRGIIINSPCNPTGAVYGEEHLRALSSVLLEAGMWVLCDDVYEHMTYSGRAPHLFKIEPRLRERGIVLNSLSKTYAMTGWRLGIAAGPREVITAVARLQGQNSGNPNSITQAAAIEALTGPQNEVATMVAEFHKRRDFVVDRVRSLPGFGLPNVPEGAFYAFPSTTPLLSANWKDAPLKDGDGVARMLLDEAQVALVGGNDFGAPDHVRISYATSMENLREAFNRIERVVRKLLGA
jgi:aspartate aminotransferase